MGQGVESREIRLDRRNRHRRSLHLGSLLRADSDPIGALQRSIRDRQLLTGLQTFDRERPSMVMTSWDLKVRHPGLKPLLAESYDTGSLDKLQERLTKAKTFELHTHKEHSVTVDGEPQQITIVKATPAEVNGDMDGKVWIRDQNEAVRTALKKLKYDPNHSQQDEDDARDLLFSTMHLMSTRPQLDRFATIIADNKLADNYLAWPQIAMEITPDGRKLESLEPTNWRHTQEAFQRLAISVFDAFDMGLITVDQLKDGNKQFLASLMPFLAAVNFTKRPNSGPWEEQMAIRTSVIGIETALLCRILTYANRPGFEFLKEGFEDAKARLMNTENTSFTTSVTKETNLDSGLVSMMVDDYVRPLARNRRVDPALERMTIDDVDNPLTQETTFDQALVSMIVKGLVTVGQKIPDESPDEPGTIRYRTADAALLDLLQYGIPELLSKYQIGIKAFGNEAGSRMDIENLISEKVEELRDEETNGLFRYGVDGEPQDTYLRGNFATDYIQWWINTLKKLLSDDAQGGPIDLNSKAELREILTGGRPAAWLHYNFVTAAWASEMALTLRMKQQAGEDISMAEIDHYKNKADEMLNRGVAGLTGPKEHTSQLNGDSTHHIEDVGELQVTECWTTVEAPDGSKIIVASPHTPLEEGKAIADRAFAIHKRTLLALAA